MTIKWGPNQDHHLLFKILETHPNIKVEYERVAEAWCDGPNKPTARAIQERLVTIRKIAKSGPFGPRRTAAATNGVNRTAAGAPISVTPGKNSKSGTGLPTPSTTRVRSIAVVGKSHKRRSFAVFDENKVTDESDIDDHPEDVSTLFNTPSKTSDRMRLRAVPQNKYTVEGEEEFGDAGSDDSDFNPNAERKMEERKARRRKCIMSYSSDEC